LSVCGIKKGSLQGFRPSFASPPFCPFSSSPRRWCSYAGCDFDEEKWQDVFSGAPEEICGRLSTADEKNMADVRGNAKAAASMMARLWTAPRANVLAQVLGVFSYKLQMCIYRHPGVTKGGASIPGVTQAFNACIRSMEVLLRNSQGALSEEDKKAGSASELVHNLQLMEKIVTTLVDACLEHEKSYAKTAAAAASRVL
jgi:hypothetical protein